MKSILDVFLCLVLLFPEDSEEIMRQLGIRKRGFLTGILCVMLTVDFLTDRTEDVQREAEQQASHHI